MPMTLLRCVALPTNHLKVFTAPTVPNRCWSVRAVCAWVYCEKLLTVLKHLFWCSVHCSRCSVVSIVNRLWAGRSGARISGGVRDDLFFRTSTPALGSTQLPVQWTPVFSPGGKAAAARSSPLSSTYCEVKGCISASPILVRLHGVDRDGCTLLYFSMIAS